MNNEINILVLSCGTRNKIVQYFKKELKGIGNVFAADSSKYAPALYEADQFFIVPKIDDPNYLANLLNICEENQITAILSLIDPELTLISNNRKQFLARGIIPLVSDVDEIVLASDKYRLSEWLELNGLHVIPTYRTKGSFLKAVTDKEIAYPVFIKPINGSASIGIRKVQTPEELDFYLTEESDLIIQKYMGGKEYGVDAYIDLMSKELVGIFIKEKIKMRAGETDKAISVRNEAILMLVKEFVSKANFIGVIDIDIFEAEGEYYISEINPRFGGGYPHAYECGVNFPKMILNNLRKQANKPRLMDYQAGVVMMKFNDVIILK